MVTVLWGSPTPLSTPLVSHCVTHTPGSTHPQHWEGFQDGDAIETQSYMDCHKTQSHLPQAREAFTVRTLQE